MARNFTGREDFRIPFRDIPVAQVVRVATGRDQTTVSTVVQVFIQSVGQGS